MQRFTYPEDETDLIIKGTGSRRSNNANGSSSVIKPPEPRSQPVKRAETEGRITVRQLESHLRRYGFGQSVRSRIWEALSDYRNRLIICFFVIFVLAGMAIILTVRTLTQSPGDANDSRQSAPAINVIRSIQSESPAIDKIPYADLHSPNNEESIPSDMVLINSWQQLYVLNDTSGAVRLRIKSLDDRSSAIKSSVYKLKNFRTIVVDARITETELNSVLVAFPALKELVLNMNELCKASEHLNPVESMGALDMTNVEVLRLVGCYECPIMDWILASKIKRLSRFELCDSKVNKRIHDLINEFVHQSHGVKIGLLQQNEFCDECVFRIEELDEETLEPETENSERCFEVV